MENYQARKMAVQKKNAQYRPSNDMKGLIASYEEAPKEEKTFKIQEEYGMNEESIEDDEIILGFSKILIFGVLFFWLNVSICNSLIGEIENFNIIISYSTKILYFRGRKRRRR